MERSRRLGGAVIVASLLVLLVAAFGPWGSGGSATNRAPNATITAFEQVESGCEGTVRDRALTGSGPGDSVRFIHVEETTSPDVSLAATVHRTSPDGAAIATYRVDVRVHPERTDATCRGAVAFRMNVSAERGRQGSRVALYVDGDPSGCSGPGCSQLLAEPTDVRWANGTGREGHIRQAYTPGVRRAGDEHRHVRGRGR